MTRIALAQTRCALGDKVENLRRMEACLEKAEADIYVFPELFLTGYMCRDRLYQLAEPPPGPRVYFLDHPSYFAELDVHGLFAYWGTDLILSSMPS